MYTEVRKRSDRDAIFVFSFDEVDNEAAVHPRAKLHLTLVSVVGPVSQVQSAGRWEVGRWNKYYFTVWEDQHVVICKMVRNVGCGAGNKPYSDYKFRTIKIIMKYFN